MSKFVEWAHAILSPSTIGLGIGAFLVLTIPLFLHLFIFRSNHLTALPSILITGPSGSGKTSFVTLFERGKNAATHTSQVPFAAECSLPVGTIAASSQYRSVNDPSNQLYKKFLLVDTPGHGKLRYHAQVNITNSQNLKGIIFLIDAASLATGNEALQSTAEYLHDILLLLQKRMADARVSKVVREMPVLIAANKMDLFTALPAALVKTTLEAEVGRVRVSRSKGLLDSGIGMGDAAETEEKDDWIGAVGSEEFKFSQMDDFGISVEVIGGSVIGVDGPEDKKWWSWIGERL